MQPRRRRKAKKVLKFRAAAADQVISLHLYLYNIFRVYVYINQKKSFFVLFLSIFLSLKALNFMN
jgi:hypothetical protein